MLVHLIDPMKHLYLLCFFLPLISFSQAEPVVDEGLTWDDFNGKEKTFFYNYSRQRENLKNEIFHLFEFTDSIPYKNDTTPDYKYVEREITQHPEKLKLHRDQMARKSNGLVSDLATEFALWELGRMLYYKGSALDDEGLNDNMALLLHYVMENIPQTGVRVLTDGTFAVKTNIEKYFDPTLTLTDKMSMIYNSGYRQLDQMLILNSIMQAEEKYVETRSRQIMEVLGGNTESYYNFLSAVGDGNSYSSDMEGFIENPLNRNLPDQNNLFCFDIYERLNEKNNVKYLKVRDIGLKDFGTKTDRHTVLHFDVNGFHKKRQTTVVIQKGGQSYILYGNNDNRLVSPDSTYGEGTTYWRLMWELENIHIKDLFENLYGKKGYEYWIDVYEDKIDDTELRIKKCEYRLNKLRTYEKPKKIKKKKFKKKDLGTSYQDGQGHPNGPPTKHDKKVNIEQNRLIHLNTLLENQKRILKQLKIEMEEAYFLYQEYLSLLDRMQKFMGYEVMPYEQEDNMYIFSDGTTFNFETQDFTFAPTAHEESFTVRHITFGKKVFSTKIEENFLHMHMSYVFPQSKYTLRKVFKDSDTLSNFVSDSIQFMEIFHALGKEDKECELKICGGGIKYEVDGEYFRDNKLVPEKGPLEDFERERVVVYRADIDNKVKISVTAWDDKMIDPQFDRLMGGFAKFKKKYPGLNEVDYYCGVYAKQKAIMMLDWLKREAENWIKDEEMKARVLKKLNKLSLKKVWFNSGSQAFKVKLPK